MLASALKKVRKHFTHEDKPLRVLFHTSRDPRRRQVAQWTTEFWGAEEPGETVLGVIRLHRLENNAPVVKEDEFIIDEHIGYISWEPIEG